MPKRRTIEFAKRAAEECLSYDKRASVRRLTRAGWKVIGRGAFSTALRHPDHRGVVIKVGTSRSERMPGYEDGFTTYARWLMDFRIKARNALRVFLVREHQSASEGMLFVAVVEELIPLRRGEHREFVNRAEKTGTNLHGKSYFKEPKEHELPPGAARRLLREIVRIGEPDIHRGNIMKRASGTLVFSDPVLLPI